MIIRDMLGNTVSEGDPVLIPFNGEFLAATVVKIEDGSLITQAVMSDKQIQAQQPQPKVIVQAILQRPVVSELNIVIGMVKAVLPQEKAVV